MVLSKQIGSNTTTPSPYSTIIPGIDFSETSIQTAVGIMFLIILFVFILSVCSKQMERRANLSHFDEIFDKHNQEEDIEAQLRDIEPETDPESKTNKTKPRKNTKADRRQSNFSPQDIQVVNDGNDTAITACASARSFAMNMNPLLGTDDPALPSIRELCVVDIMIVDARVKIMSLIHDCDMICRDLIIDSGKNQGDEITTEKRPQFLCVVQFNEIANQGALARISNLLHKGFDGVVVRGLSEAWDLKCRSSLPEQNIEEEEEEKEEGENVENEIQKEKVRVTSSMKKERKKRMKKNKEWLDITLLNVLEITSSLQKPFIVEMDNSPVLDLDLNLVNGIFFTNPTMKKNGQPKLVWGKEHQKMEKFVNVLKKHVSMSIEFTLLAINVVEDGTF
tara:strand:- start:120 stop:1298 length:1179 start_codon:yes stop_codon:yes gene_type:complete